MARMAGIGEMRTRVVVRRLKTGIDEDGFKTVAREDVFPGPVWCKWVWAHGAEALENMRTQMTQTATLTMHYTGRITPRCQIWRAGEADDESAAWDVVSVNNVEDRRQYLEVQIRKGVKA